MTLTQFRLMLPAAQLAWVLAKGTHLAQRWHYQSGVNLYYLPDGARGFFAEVALDEAQSCFVVLRSFTSAAPLEEYTLSIELPEDL